MCASYYVAYWIVGIKFDYIKFVIRWISLAARVCVNSIEIAGFYVKYINSLPHGGGAGQNPHTNYSMGIMSITPHPG